MQRRAYLKASGGLAFGAMVAGCTASSDSTGTLATSVSDQPRDIGDFERFVVTIFEIRVFPRDDTEGEDTPEENDTEGDDTEDSGEPIVIEVDDEEADLVELQGETSQLVDESELEVGEYTHLQLRVRDEVDAQLDGGGDAEVMTPGDAPLTFNRAFEIRQSQRTQFTADFAPVRQGRTNRYLLRPVPAEIHVEYEDDDTDGNESDV